MAFVDVFEALETFDEVLVRDFVVFGVEEVHYAD